MTSSEDARLRLEAIFESAVFAIVTIDEVGVVEAFNRTAETMFGYRSDEVVGQNVRMLMPEPFRSAHDGFLQSYLATGERKIIGIGREVSGQRSDGSKFPIHVTVSEVRAGRSQALYWHDRGYFGTSRCRAARSATARRADSCCAPERHGRTCLGFGPRAQSATDGHNELLQCCPAIAQRRQNGRGNRIGSQGKRSGVAGPEKSSADCGNSSNGAKPTVPGRTSRRLSGKRPNWA